jgi:RHS repeat-associated protein
MIQPGRKFSAVGAYRYGFNGKENDNEVSGEGNVYDYGFRVYNPRIGRFLSVDPLFQSYPWYTPYQFAGNMPIWAIDLDGLEEKKSTIIHTVRIFDAKGSLIKEPTLVEYGCTGCTVLVTPTSQVMQKGDEDGDTYETFTDYHQVEGTKFWICADCSIKISAHKVPSPEPIDKNNTVQTNETEKVTGTDDRKPVVSWRYGVITSATPNMNTSTTVSEMTKNLDVAFESGEAKFDGNGGKSISDYVSSLPPGTSSVNVVVGTAYLKSDCIERGFLGIGCKYDAEDLLKDRVKLVTPFFKKSGISFIITPKFDDHIKVTATALVPVTQISNSISNWDVNKQPVKQKLINGKPVGNIIPNGNTAPSTSTTKPKTGITWKK